MKTQKTSTVFKAAALVAGLFLSNCAVLAGEEDVVKVNEGPPVDATEPTAKVDCELAQEKLAATEPSQLDKPEILGVCQDKKNSLMVVFTANKKGAAVSLKPGDASFALAKLVSSDGVNSSYWVSYINKYETPAISSEWPGTTKQLQATTENTGTLTDLGKGVYAYTFTNPVTATTEPVVVKWEPTKTHRVGIEFRGAILDPVLGNPTYTWLPHTGKTEGLPATRDMVATESCNECHDRLEAHGGARTEVEYCVLCHNPGSTDANSGNTVDFKIMAHKIHRGKNLLSVKAGGEYAIWGYKDTKYDFSTVGFPQEQRNCIKCHDPANPATPDAASYNTANKLTVAYCTTCHDITFDVGTATHSAGAQSTDNCVSCHGPNGFFSYEKRHTSNFITPHNKGLPANVPVVTYILRDLSLVPNPAVANSAATMPVVTFGILLDGVPLNIKSAPWTITGTSRLSYGQYKGKNILDLPSLMIAFSVTETTVPLWSSLLQTEPGLDFNNWFTNFSSAEFSGRSAAGSYPTDQIKYAQPGAFSLTNTSGAKAGYPQGVALTGNLIANGDGTFTTKPYQLLSVPANAKNVSVLMQGYVGVDIDGSNSTVTDERIGGDSKIIGVGLTTTPRRQIVAIEKCNTCHERLSLHGGNRVNNPDLCVACHNPNATDGSRRPASASLAVDGLAEQSVSFPHMIHRIHRGEEMASNQYVIYGFGNTPIDLKEVRFPGNIKKCETCHNPGTYELPLSDGALATTVLTGANKSSPWDDLNISAAGAACTGCHDKPSAQAHATVSAVYQSINLHGIENDSCVICHGPGAGYDVKSLHATE